MGKIIFLDIDGTLRDFDGTIPKSAVEAIQKARERGHKVCLSTGRPMWQIDEKVRNIGFDGIVSGSGSYVEYEGKRVRHKHFTLLTYIELCKYLLEHHCVIEIHTHTNGFILKHQEEAFQAVKEIVKSEVAISAEEVDSWYKPIDHVMDVARAEKILFFGKELTVEEVLKKWGKSLYVVPLSIPTLEDGGGEITPIYINKAEGIRSILEAGGFKREDAVAVGDGINDIEMIQFAGIGIAMGNAEDAVKEAADIVTSSVQEDGIYQAFQKAGL